MSLNEHPVDSMFEDHFLTDEQKEERAKQMYALYSNAENPHSLEDVGKAFEGLTRERVRQILREYGYPIRSRRGTAMAKRNRSDQSG